MFLYICALAQYILLLYSSIVAVYMRSFNVLLILFIHHRSRSHTHQPNWKLICTLSLDVTKFLHLHSSSLYLSPFRFFLHFSGVFLPTVKKRFYFLVEYYKHILQSVCVWMDGRQKKIHNTLCISHNIWLELTTTTTTNSKSRVKEKNSSKNQVLKIRICLLWVHRFFFNAFCWCCCCCCCCFSF